jgi:hypothetical protein
MTQLRRLAAVLLVRPADQPHGPVLAEGLLHTGETPNADGYYTILAASGSRNGVAISTLLPLGSSIPGNAGYFSDNLLRVGAPPLTSHGFNVSYVDGSYSNFFSATFLSPVDMDFHSVPPNFSKLPDTELTGLFVARQVPVPGPLPAAGVGLALAWSRRLRSRRGVLR